MNVCWLSNEVEYANILKFALSIPLRFKVKDLYLRSESKDEYVLKGFVAFLGAHYMTFIKQEYKGRAFWRLYDDQRILSFEKWQDVLNMVLEQTILPTLLIYEEAT